MNKKIYNFLNQDVKDLNLKLLLISGFIFIFLVGLISYKTSNNNSYALFTDTVNGTSTITLTYVETGDSIDESGANAPVLSKNMIPVYYDETNSTWKKANKYNCSENYKWYDYDAKMWANSVTVSETNREKYVLAPPGTTIPMSDILTMQVWIPRYKYKVWNYNDNGTSTSTAQEIDIAFENETETTGQIKCTDSISGTNGAVSEECTYQNQTCTNSLCNGKTYTHPAFTFGDTELEGIWVGKFEIGKTDSCSSSSYTNVGSGCNLKTIHPIVKPDVQSWRAAQVGTFDYVMRNMNSSNNQYGFKNTDDTHMMKNTEWGAVAYLSHSKYGMNDEVYINNSSSYYTGRSGSFADDGYISAGTYRYNQKGTELNVTEGTGTETTLILSDSGETYPWTETNGVYKSSNQGQQSTTSTAKFNITATANTVLSFDWIVSSRYSYDRLYFRVLNSSNTAIYTSPYHTGYINRTNENNLPYKHFNYLLITAGTYTLEVNYQKTGTSTAQGLDTAYIKNIKTIAGATYENKATNGGAMASTTGNIYGIYDMSGGAWEYVMSNVVSPNGTTMISGYSNASSTPYYHSAFSGKVYNSGAFDDLTGEYEYPDNKYLDKYSYSTSSTQRKRGKLGDGIKEVFVSGGVGWNEDYNYLAYSASPWFIRGGAYNFSSIAGLFRSNHTYGNANGNSSARLVVVSSAP